VFGGLHFIKVEFGDGAVESIAKPVNSIPTGGDISKESRAGSDGRLVDRILHVYSYAGFVRIQLEIRSTKAATVIMYSEGTFLLSYQSAYIIPQSPNRIQSAFLSSL
jgi:hypothetical protein